MELHGEPLKPTIPVARGTAQPRTRGYRQTAATNPSRAQSSAGTPLPARGAGPRDGAGGGSAGTAGAPSRAAADTTRSPSAPSSRCSGRFQPQVCKMAPALPLPPHSRVICGICFARWALPAPLRSGTAGRGGRAGAAGPGLGLELEL